MANTVPNGPSSPVEKFLDKIDTEDPDYIRELRRPPDVKVDISQMDNRSRVKMILNSQSFREELEQIIEAQLNSGNNPSSLLALQQISNLLFPQSRPQGGVAGSSTIIPINDIRGVDSLNYHKTEKQLRCKLAALYRIIDLHGWTDGIYNHVTARIDQDHEHFLINPFGLLYSEVTASNLVKVDMQGQIIDNGSTQFGINQAGYTLHSSIHAARPDIKCIIHLHTSPVVAVSAMTSGLLPVTREAMICGKLTYHDYNGILVDEDEKDKLARDLGPSSMVLILRNHGVAICGRTVEEAYHYCVNFVTACEHQLKMMPIGIENLYIPSEEDQKNLYQEANRSGLGTDSFGRKLRIGELQFEALMRQLDNAGYRTGYGYHVPLVKHEKKDRANSEVEIPPSASSFSHDDDTFILSPIKAALEKQKQSHKVGWLNSPNVYTKKEIEEIGTDTPKKITKWVSEDGDTAGSTTTKIENPNVFAPQGDNPKEFKSMQKLIRKDYYEEKISAGPQSKILEGVTYEEADKIREGKLSGTADTVVIVGAASKGIIQRDHQHNVAMYKSTYAPNPFQNVNEDELKNYQQQIEGATTNESDDLSPGPEGRLISTDERMSNLQTRVESSEVPKISNETQEPINIPEVKADITFTNLESRPPVQKMEYPRLDVSVGRSESTRDSRQSAGESEKPASPTKSTDSADHVEGKSSKEGSPTKDLTPKAKEKDKGKKKKKFHIPSFSKKKKEKGPKEE